MTQPSQAPPPHAALLQMILGKWVSSAISAAAHFGIADHLEAGAVVQSYDFSRFEHIVDVAGGHGALLAAILDQAPKLRGTLVEMPHVIEGARKAGILDRFANRCTLEAASMFESVPPDADAYI